MYLYIYIYVGVCIYIALLESLHQTLEAAQDPEAPAHFGVEAGALGGGLWHPGTDKRVSDPAPQVPK